MSDYEFFNRMINRITKDYDYDIANRFQRLFIKKENENIELQERIDKAIEYIKYNLKSFIYSKEYKDLMKILGEEINTNNNAEDREDLETQLARWEDMKD